MTSVPPNIDDLRFRLAAAGRLFASRGWMRATSGNLSAVLRHDPLDLLVTVSGSDKGLLGRNDFVVVDDDGQAKRLEHAVRWERGRASAEAPLHAMLVRRTGAGAVLHTHSVWSTVVSDAVAAGGLLRIEGFEMLKAFRGVETHEHVLEVPVFENTQDMVGLARRVESHVDGAGPHGFLLRRHGLYAWGHDVDEAKRHVEAFEFLFEVLARGAARS